MDRSKLFDKTYRDYLTQIKTIDWSKKAERLGLQQQDNVLIFDFFNRRIAFNGDEFIDTQGYEVTTAVKVVCCCYLLMRLEVAIHTSNRLVSFREFSNAGPLYSRFSENTGKIITTTFTGQLARLKARCHSLGGTTRETASYDLSVQFSALCRVPMILNFNDADEWIPANAGFLFQADAERYLDLPCLTIIGTYLTGLLIQAG